MSEAGIQFGDRFVSQAEFSDRVAKAATGLNSLGIRSTDSGKLFKRKLREPYWKDAGRNM